MPTDSFSSSEGSLGLAAADEPGRLDDSRLWGRLVVGDPSALGLLYDRHCAAVYNFAFRRTASWSAAEDILQATFITVWRKATRHSLPLLDHSSALPWLLGVASREGQTSTRTRLREERRDARAQLVSVVSDHADEVVARVDDERQMSVVRRAMQRIPRHERVVIELVHWSGLSIAEAGEVLGVANGTIKSRLSRGRARLSTLLDPADLEKENR